MTKPLTVKDAYIMGKRSYNVGNLVNPFHSDCEYYLYCAWEDGFAYAQGQQHDEFVYSNHAYAPMQEISL